MLLLSMRNIIVYIFDCDAKGDVISHFLTFRLKSDQLFKTFAKINLKKTINGPLNNNS